MMDASCADTTGVMHMQPATQGALTLLLQKHDELKENGGLTAGGNHRASDCNVLGCTYLFI